MTKKPIIGLVAAIILAVVFVPFSSTVSPLWEIQVIDEFGEPFPRANLSQTWQYYSLEEKSHHEEICADSNGRGIFERRIIWANLASRVFGVVHEFASVGVHASYGPSAWVIASGKGYDNHSAKYDSGVPITIIQLKRHAPDSIFVHRKKCD